MMEKLKKRWGVSSTWQVVIILVVFSLAGSSIMYVRPFVYKLLHMSAESSLWIKIPVFFLIYQVMLLTFGTLFGHFRFFWEKEKKMFYFLMKPFGLKPSKAGGPQTSGAGH